MFGARWAPANKQTLATATPLHCSSCQFHPVYINYHSLSASSWATSTIPGFYPMYVKLEHLKSSEVYRLFPPTSFCHFHSSFPQLPTGNRTSSACPNCACVSTPHPVPNGKTLLKMNWLSKTAYNSTEMYCSKKLEGGKFPPNTQLLWYIQIRYWPPLQTQPIFSMLYSFWKPPSEKQIYVLETLFKMHKDIPTSRIISSPSAPMIKKNLKC